MARSERPLSPHLGIYRWQISNSLSILHRATGVFLSLGALMLVAWLVAVASGFDSYARVSTFLSGPLGLLLLLGWVFCFSYHFCNGIRHLFWDAGRGFEPEVARRSGWAVVVVACGMTIVYASAAIGL